MSATPTDLDALITEARALFQELKAYSDALQADEGVNASVRAVLEHLEERGPQTVPAIAREKNVSRQHIQQIVDLAAAAGLTESRANPAHKRSVLIALTQAGSDAFGRIRAREKTALSRVAKALQAHDLTKTAETLQTLCAALTADRLRSTTKETTID